MDSIRLTPAHELLLRAALLRDEAALAAYGQWKALVRFDDIDPEAYRLLPCLYRNLHALGVADELNPRLRGIYRRTWYANQLALPVIGETVSALCKADIETRVLGGALSILHYGNDLGLYPLDDVDVLPRPGHYAAALAVLCNLDWKPFKSNHGVWILKHSQAGYLALHRQIVHGLTPEAWTEANAHIWRSPQTIGVNDQDIQLINPADHLLFITDYGLKGGGLPPLRWLTEAAVLLTSDTPIGWEDLLAQARLRHAGAPLNTLLLSLSAILSLNLPEGFLDELMTPVPTPKPAFDEQVDLTALPVWRRLLQASSNLWRHYRRSTAQQSAVPTLSGFARYLAQRWQLASPRQLPGAIGRRALHLAGLPHKASGHDA